MPLKQLFVITCVVALSIASCAPQVTAIPQIVENVPSPSTATPAGEIAISTPAFMGVLFSDSVPQGLQELVESYEIPFSASMNMDVARQNGTNGIHFEWVYALVAPFPTVTDGVTFEDFQSTWVDGTPLSPVNRSPLLMAESTLEAFTAIWGEPASGSVRSVVEDELLDIAWAESAWAIIPFESLDPKWKVLTIDGQSPIRKKFDVADYPLVVDFVLGPAEIVDASSWTLTNYDPSKLTTVIMTGVTALVRATALTMELKGSTYPGEKVRDVFREADIMHVSNEIPFFTGCPYPKPEPGALVFCSDPKYMDLITDIGTDVIELTGNHFADYGPQAMYETLDLYRLSNIPYFGGGQDLQDSLKPALFDMNGNKIAFIGCNKPDVGRFPTATDYQPGAAPCDFDYLSQKINSLKAEGYVVVSTFQWNESYDSKPAPEQRNDFRLMADSGASIVSGSQAHYAQMMEFHGDAFIHYGLGNLFFDQMGDQDWMPPGIRRLFFDRYVIYDGGLVSVELLTGLLEDYSRPRFMNEEERADFLQEYFYYSGWKPLIPTPTPAVTPTLTPMSVP